MWSCWWAGGADANALDPDGNPALAMAVQSGAAAANVADIIQHLLKAGADINWNFAGGSRGTALHWACEHGAKSIADLLLWHQAACNALNCDAETPFMVAAKKGRSDVMEALIKHDSALWKHAAPNDSSIMHWASGSGQDEALAILLSEAGANASDGDKTGNTSLHLAAGGGVRHLRVTHPGRLGAREEGSCSALGHAQQRQSDTTALCVRPRPCGHLAARRAVPAASA